MATELFHVVTCTDNTYRGAFSSLELALAFIENGETANGEKFDAEDDQAIVYYSRLDEPADIGLDDTHRVWPPLCEQRSSSPPAKKQKTNPTN